MAISLRKVDDIVSWFLSSEAHNKLKKFWELGCLGALAMTMHSCYVARCYVHVACLCGCLITRS